MIKERSETHPVKYQNIKLSEEMQMVELSLYRFNTQLKWPFFNEEIKEK